MTKKEEQPRNNEQDPNEKNNRPYDPEINEHDKDILNNQSQDADHGVNAEDRQQPVDYAGADLDIPGEDDRKFNPTTNKPQDVEKERKPKESANSNDNIESQSQTIYRGEEAEKYKDPSEKTRPKKE